MLWVIDLMVLRISKYLGGEFPASEHTGCSRGGSRIKSVMILRLLFHDAGSGQYMHSNMRFTKIYLMRDLLWSCSASSTALVESYDRMEWRHMPWK
jgi:hypothetical protein